MNVHLFGHLLLLASLILVYEKQQMLDENNLEMKVEAFSKTIFT
jgi:hypothetical protein